MVKAVDNLVSTLNGEPVSVIKVKFENGKGIKIIFDREGNQIKEG